MTPDKNFRMDRLTKTMMAGSLTKPEVRNQIKNMFIQAQLSDEAAKRAALKSKDSGEGRDNKEKTSNHASHTRGAVAPE